jgi:Phosphorylase superfamily
MVGMSTIPEVVAAHHCDMKVLCLSLITNKVIMEGHEGPVASHQEVLEAVEKRSTQMQALVKQIVAVLKRKILPELSDLMTVDLTVPLPRYALSSSWFPLYAMVAVGAMIATVVAKK